MSLCSCLLPLLSSDRSQDSTAVALSDSSSTQDFFNEPTSLLEGSRKLFPEKRLSGLSAQAGPSGKDLPGPTEERGKKPNVLDWASFDRLGQSRKT